VDEGPVAQPATAATTQSSNAILICMAVSLVSWPSLSPDKRIELGGLRPTQYIRRAAEQFRNKSSRREISCLQTTLS
jgi:hypothetical protein